MFKLRIELKNDKTVSLIAKWSRVIDLCLNNRVGPFPWSPQFLADMEETIESLRGAANHMEVILNEQRALERKFKKD